MLVIPRRRLFAVLHLVLLAWVCQTPTAAAQASGPLLVRNITPVAHLYGVPAALGGRLWRTAEDARFEYSLNLEHASSFTNARRLNSAVFFDGETTVATYLVRGGFGESGAARHTGRWEWGVALPLVMHSGGFLDGLIDEFHETFGLRDGGRPIAERNRIDYLVQLDGEIYANFQDSKSRIGDVRAWLGYQWLDSPQRSLALRSQLKLPTGSVASLSGSGAADLAAWLEHTEHTVLGNDKVGMNLMLGAVYLGEGDLAPRWQQDAALFAQFGLYYQYNRWVQLHAQIAGQTQLIDSDILQAQGPAVQGTLGGRVQVNSRVFVDLGLVEDLRTKSSADVVFHLRLSAQM